MRSVTAFAPATVSNVGCGFDVLGFALESPGDEVMARAVDRGGVVIEDIAGDDGRLPFEPGRNTASVAAQAVLDRAGSRQGVALTVRKGLPLASGLGGSAASAAAAAVAVNALIGGGATPEVLIACALEGERVGAGSAHADNVAPAICGGLVLVRAANPPDVIRLPVPTGLTAVVVHPDLEIETAAARAILGDTVLLRDAVQQWANVGAFVDALHRRDFALLARTLEDVVAEPRRAALVPGLGEIKKAALASGALGCGLSGSGPAVFALCTSPNVAPAVAAAMRQASALATGGSPQVYISPVGSPGARIVA